MAARTHTSFPSPSDTSVRLWRYMSITKLIDFLRTQSLFLPRLDKLEDPYEGQFPKRVVEKVNTEYKQLEQACGRDPGKEPQFAEMIVRHTRTAVYVNCWCSNVVESEALWRIYGYPDSVALTTSFSSLAGCLPDSVYIGEVKYMDYEKHEISPDNMFNIVMHKRSFFAHEREVRVVTQLAPNNLSRPSEAPGGTPSFLTVPVPFAAFEEIRLSPYAQGWLEPLLKDLVQRFNCPIPVVRSAMLK
jgi:hypothetical protein